MRYLLTLTAASGNALLRTSDAGAASQWLAHVLTHASPGDRIAVLIDGRDHGARIAARLMSLSVPAVAAALAAETARAA